MRHSRTPFSKKVNRNYLEKALSVHFFSFVDSFEFVLLNNGNSRRT
ncbi:MAG: hypothetical protein OEU76_03085 [Cyclobacteriaceae bacterium]|nr:hypothetical protein [Cyclobacteriaceae bacterium]